MTEEVSSYIVAKGIFIHTLCSSASNSPVTVYPTLCNAFSPVYNKDWIIGLVHGIGNMGASAPGAHVTF